MGIHRTVDQSDFLKKLAATRSAEKRKQILINCTPEQAYVLVEICHNILKGKIPISTKQKKILESFAPYIRSLARKRTTQSANKVLQQGSGFPFALLIAPALRAAFDLLNA